jgi:hypothetical protein
MLTVIIEKEDTYERMNKSENKYRNKYRPKKEESKKTERKKGRKDKATFSNLMSNKNAFICVLHFIQ